MKAFEPIYDTLKTNHIEKIATTEIPLVVKARTQNGQEIESVLQVCAGAVVTGGEALSGQSTFSGVTQVKIMFMTAEKKVDYMTYQTEFNGKIDNKMIDPKCVPVYTCSVISVETAGVDGCDAAINLVIQVDMQAVMMGEVKYLAELSGNMYARKEESCCTSISAYGSGNFSSQASVEIKDMLSGVLTSSANAIVTDASSGLDCIVASGHIYVTLNYKCDADSLNVKSVDIDVPFSDELTANGATVAERSAARCGIKSIKVVAEVDEESKKSKIIVTCEYVLSGESYAKKEFEKVCDVFSPIYNLEMKANEYMCKGLKDTYVFDDKITTNFELADDVEIDKVLGVISSKVTVADCYMSEEKVVVEGIVACDILCLAGETLKAFKSENMFSMSYMTGDDVHFSEMVATVAVPCVVAKHKRTKQIDLHIDLMASVICYTESGGKVIDDMKITSEKPCNECAIEVYVAGEDESLWDVAKTLNVTPDMIEIQNPGAQFPTSSGDKIIAYHQYKRM